MSRYTTEVRWIMESKSELDEEELKAASVDDIIEAARENFVLAWPAYNGDWKAMIEHFIYKYYYTREIGFETVGLWKLKLETRLTEISDKYNIIIAEIEKTYDSETSAYDLTKLLYNIDVAMYGKTETSGESKDKYSDTPQGTLANVETGTYLTDYRNIESGGSQETNSTEKGYRGSKTKAELLNDSSLDMLDVCNRMADECSDLFFGLWE